MTRLERLRVSIEGRGVNRPPVCFPEINGCERKAPTARFLCQPGASLYLCRWRSSDVLGLNADSV